MTPATDIIFAQPLGSYVELRFNKALCSVRLVRSGRLTEKKTHNATFQLEEYFRGERMDFSCDIDLSGLSGFQRRVLDETVKIKFGTQITYAVLAKRVNSSPRAVGGALAKNPVPIFIPCHRVVAISGIGGFSMGVDIKNRLIEHEQKILANNL